MADQAKLAEQFGTSEGGNFAIVDTIAVPHPYCITPKHVAVAADQFSGMLTKAAIVAAEKQGAKCGICRGKLAFDQHETALLVECKLPLTTQEGTGTELHKYLLECKR